MFPRNAKPASAARPVRTPAALALAAALVLALAPSRAPAAGDKLENPLKNLDAVERAIDAGPIPKLAIQHRGLDISLTHRARYFLSDVAGKSSFPGENPVFTYLGMLYAPTQWDDAKLFPIEHPGLAERLRHHRKDRLAASDFGPGLGRYLSRIEQLGRAMPENLARRLVELPSDKEAPLSREAFGQAFVRAVRVNAEMTALRQAGRKLDVELYKSLREALGEAEEIDPWADPATAKVADLLYVNYLTGSIPRARLIDFMAIAGGQFMGHGGQSDLAGLQALVNDADTFGFPDKSLVTAIGKLFGRYTTFQRRLENVRMVAVPGSLENAWVSPPEAAMLRGADAEPVAKAAWEFHNALVRAYQSGEAEGLNAAAAAFLSRMKQDERYTSDLRREASWFYTAGKPFLWACLIYLLSSLAFAGASIKGRPSGGFYQSARALLFSGFVVHTLGIACRVAIMGRAPVSNIWESIVWVTWGGLLFGAFFELRYRSIFPGLVTGAVGFLALLASYSMPNETTQMQPLRAVLVSSWLTYHVLGITLSYAAFMISAAFSVSYLIKDGSLLGWAPGGRAVSSWAGALMPSEATIELFAYRAIQIGYPLLTWGIFSGAVWADHAWGRFWAWDPKETWSLITWLIYTAFLHMRLRRGLSGRALAWMSLGGFACVLTTWLGVSYLPIFAGLHSYANG